MNFGFFLLQSEKDVQVASRADFISRHAPYTREK